MIAKSRLEIVIVQDALLGAEHAKRLPAEMSIKLRCSNVASVVSISVAMRGSRAGVKASANSSRVIGKAEWEFDDAISCL